MKNKILILLLILFYGCQEKEETCFFSSGEKLNERVIKKLISNDECKVTLREIKKINLSNQKLKDINFLSELPNIEFLDLSNNLISNIKPIKSLGKLKFLNLRNNYIEEINDLKSNKKLEKVLLEGNVIKGEEDYCPTDFELKKLNDFCLKLSEISKLEISLSKVSNDRCSQDKPINLLLKKNWGKIGLLNKKNEIIKKNDFGSWSGFMRQMPLYDQGETGLCYAFAAIQLIDYWRETHGVKVTKKMAYSSPLYGAFLLKSLDKKELQNSLDYGYSAKVISYVKKNGMCRSDIINNSLKKINLGEDVTEIDFYKALKDVFKAKKMVSKDKLLKTAKRYDLENYASLSLNSKSLVDAFQIIFSECKKPTSIYLNSKNIPEPTVIRIESLEKLLEINFDGYALGGLAVGEKQNEMFEVLDNITNKMPKNKPRYLMGVGTPSDLLGAVKSGIDMFDCVLPTRSGRTGLAFTWDGKVNIRNSKYKKDLKPLDENTNLRSLNKYSKSYLNHLINTNEILASMLISLHNINFYQEFMKKIRTSIKDGTFDDFYKENIFKFN